MSSISSTGGLASELGGSDATNSARDLRGSLPIHWFTPSSVASDICCVLVTDKDVCENGEIERQGAARIARCPWLAAPQKEATGSR